MLNRKKREFPGCESDQPPSYVWHPREMGNDGEWHDLGDLYICYQHDAVVESRYERTELIGFNSKDGMRNHAYRLARLKPCTWNSLRG